VGGAAGVPGPAIIPVGYEAVSGFSADERSASATFVKWSKHLQRKGVDPDTSKISLHLAEEILFDRERLDGRRAGLGSRDPQSTLDAIAAKNAKGA